MAPRNKFTKEEMVAAALRVVRSKGIDGLTAKTMASALGTSTQPIFTAFGSMEGVRQAVYAAAIRVYDDYTNAGLQRETPFLGVGMQYIRFAQDVPELYRLLFLAQARTQECSTTTSMRYLQEKVCPTLMSIYHITAEEAEFYFRNLWLVVHGLSTLIVTGNCPYNEQEIEQTLMSFSISICKSIKEIPGFVAGSFNRDEVFRSIVCK